MRVYERVRRHMPGLFNALSLATLQLGRPSALEALELCREYRDDLDYIAGWRAWYKEIDRAGSFWTEAEKKAKFAFSSGSSPQNGEKNAEMSAEISKKFAEFQENDETHVAC